MLSGAIRAESPPDFLAIKALPAAPHLPRPYGHLPLHGRKPHVSLSLDHV